MSSIVHNSCLKKTILTLLDPIYEPLCLVIQGTRELEAEKTRDDDA